MPPSSIGRKLWKSAETNSKRQTSIDKYAQETELEKTLLNARIVAVVPTSLHDVVQVACGKHKVRPPASRKAHFMLVSLARM